MAHTDLPRVQERRIGAYGICIHNGRMLLIHKAKGPYTGLLDLPGGGIEWGEAPDETLVREFLEETGLAVVAGEIAGVYHRVSEFLGDAKDRWVHLHHLGFLYRVAPVDASAAVATGADGLDSLGAEWVPLALLPPGRISPLVARALEIIGPQNGRGQ
ncbi:MAG TPA: NUDIX hydrolase [Symbiobacteriaceae bacterium]|nr:NUDIX hydrolase [Symbiobacteriaceae bacterium]